MLELIHEAKWLTRLGIQIPDSAASIMQQESRFKNYKSHLEMVLREFRAVCEAIPEALSNLFKPHVEFVEQQLQPGLTTLAWNSMNIGKKTLAAFRNTCTCTSDVDPSVHYVGLSLFSPIEIIEQIKQWLHIWTLSTLSNFNGLFQSLFWINLKQSVVLKGLKCVFLHLRHWELFVLFLDAFLHQVHTATQRLKSQQGKVQEILEGTIESTLDTISTFYIFDYEEAVSRSWVCCTFNIILSNIVEGFCISSFW